MSLTLYQIIRRSYKPPNFVSARRRTAAIIDFGERTEIALSG
jgi:hypothetical protein